MRPRTHLLAALATCVVFLSGCGSENDDPADPATGSGPVSEIAITIEGDTVTPNGKRVDVALDAPVELKVTADVPGELHIHTSPEQEIAYEAGTSTHTLTFDRPGVVEVESHDLEKIIVQLEVR